MPVPRVDAKVGQRVLFYVNSTIKLPGNITHISANNRVIFAQLDGVVAESKFTLRRDGTYALAGDGKSYLFLGQVK